jgi:cobalt-zinc-cadmium efflux system outer membrane protein
VLLTATVATLGLLPAALARGIGSDVQRPLATVVVGGLVTATILTLVLLPVLYLALERRFPVSQAAAKASAAPAVTAALLAILLMPRTATAAAPDGPPATLDFRTYVEQAFASNPDLAAAHQGVAIANAQIDVAKAFPDPELTAGLSSYDLSRRGNATAAGASISVPIELGGKRGARVAVARFGVDAARHDYDEAARALRASAAGAFADSLHARLVVLHKQQVLGNLRRLVDINGRRLAAGDVPEVALVQSRVEARQFEADVLTATGERTALDVSLLQLLGPAAASVPASFELAGDLRSVASAIDTPRVLATVEKRPDVLAAAARLAQAERQVRLEEAKRVVDVSVGVGWTHNYPVSGDGGSPAADFIGASLTIPLPLSRVYKGELEAARSAKRQSEYQLASARARAESEVRQAVARFEAAAERVKLYDAGALADADAVLEKTLYNYQHGGATLTDYIVAERTASDVHLAYLDALNDRAHALAALEQASGLSDLVRF